MSNDDLTFVQRCALITLLVERREVPNAELDRVFRLSLKLDQREALIAAGYITVRQEKKGRPAFLTITAKGRKRAAAEFGTAVPERPGAGGAALYRVLASLKAYLDSIGQTPEAFYGGDAPVASPVVEPVATTVVAATDDLETLIRKAYGAVATRSGDYVLLSRLRPQLADVPKVEVDAALKRLNREPDVNLAPESDQKRLGPADRAAAVVIGHQDKHLISIGH
jgi:hypothetical protein